jgi:hypothetical protein
MNAGVRNRQTPSDRVDASQRGHFASPSTPVMPPEMNTTERVQQATAGSNRLDRLSGDIAD